MSKKKSARKNGNAKPKAAHPLREASPMDTRLLEQLVRLMQANDLTTIEVRDGDKRVILKRGEEESAPAAGAGAQAAAKAAAPAAAVEADLHPIKSPMVGTFYAASGPDAKPLVSVGSAVDEETDVCVIEAMKVFNNIRAECRGTIARILVDNGQTVEFGQTLFLVKKG